MFKTYYHYVYLLLITIALVHCNQDIEAKSFTIDTEKSAALIRTEKGSSFTIKLKNFVATGYSWEIEHQFGDDITFLNKNILANVNKNKVNNQDKAQPTMVGGTQIEEFNYTVSNDIKYSSVTVDFILKRSWEPEPVKRISVVIRFDKL